jgi:thiol-disulfide isomerase/thioredoxin
MNRFSLARVVAAFGLALSLGLLPAAAAEADAKKFDPEAEKTLRQVSEFYRGLKSLKVDATMSVLVQSPGMKQEMTAKYVIAAQRPNKISLAASGGQMDASLTCDGTKVYTYIAALKQYLVKDAPADFDAMFSGEDAAMNAMLMQGLFIDMLLRSNPYDLIMENVDSLRAAGTEDVAGVKCHHLKFTQEQVNLELWVEAAPQPVVRKLVMDMSEAMAAAHGETASKDLKMEMTVTFTNWAVDPALPADTFAFTPPAGAKQVTSSAPEEEEAPSPLLGKPAPAFSLPLLDGGQVKLQDLKDKQVVILDFWAVWCGPCRRSLPILAELAEVYKAKGVAFYAVDEEESAEKIRQFLKKTELKLTVALDKDGKVGKDYGVRGIPQTVLVGKDGSVQAVHVGYDPDMRKTLAAELDALLADKKLVGKANATAAPKEAPNGTPAKQ